MRLEQRDSFLWSFESEVVDIAGDRLFLSESAFYPESGGQMADHGVLEHAAGVARVVDVQLVDGRVAHAIEGEAPPIGAKVAGRIEGARRREHMSLHTAQHMLSRALADEGFETVSARLGESAATIDTDRALTHEVAREAAERVQGVVDEDREIRTLYPNADELAAMKLRRTPKVTQGIRIIEVAGFDLTPCGGTHCTRTAQVGLVHVTDVQSYKGGSRVTFVSGSRSRRWLLAHSAALRDLAARFKCPPEEVMAAVEKQDAQLRASREALGVARAGWASAIVAGVGEAPLIVETFTGLDRDTLRSVATKLATGSRVVALSSIEGDAQHVIVARGEASSVDCGKVLREVAKTLGGSGGGRPEKAEGRVPVEGDWRAAFASGRLVSE